MAARRIDFEGESPPDPYDQGENLKRGYFRWDGLGPYKAIRGMSGVRYLRLTSVKPAPQDYVTVALVESGGLLYVYVKRGASRDAEDSCEGYVIVPDWGAYERAERLYLTLVLTHLTRTLGQPPDYDASNLSEGSY